MMRKLVVLVLGVVFLSATTFAFAEDVYVTKRGKKYHQEGCLLIKNKGAKQITKKEALEKGLTPCQRCFNEEVSSNDKEKSKERLVKKEKSKN